MTAKARYYFQRKKYRDIIAFLRLTVLILITSQCIHTRCLGNDEPELDEISVFITVPGLGSTEMPAVIIKETAYLAVANIFEFLKIKSTLSPALDSVYGFFIDPRAVFLIDKKSNRIFYAGKVTELAGNDLVQTETNLYLKADYFGQVFGLVCTFNFRSLSVILQTKLELPVIREMRLEAMRNNASQLKGDMKADTSILRNYPGFHFGMADWAVISSQDIKGADNTRVNLSLGTVIAGGETNISLNYDSNLPFSERQQTYLWRLVDNDRKGIKQVMAGKIFTQANASIFSPVVGVQFTNTPTTYRRSFGTYVLSQTTEPNWMVELYVNNIMVNYVKADASGFFTFEVPLVYGNSMVKLRFYGPYGEERTSEQHFNIPFNFVPVHKLEYNVSAGMVEDSLNSGFSRASFNYGAGKRLTIGGGMEYLSSVVTGRYMPFMNTSARLAPNLLVSAEYIHNVRLKNVLSYRLPSNLQFELSYNRYKRGQKAINNTYLEERKALVSYPFRSKKLSVFSRLTVYQIILPSSSYTTAEALISGVAYGLNVNLTTYSIFITEANPYVYSNLSSTFRLPGKLFFTPQLQYEFNNAKFMGIKGEITKSISRHGFANIYYENNFKVGVQSVGLGFRYDFSFAQLSFFARRGDHTTTLTQTARGSLMYNGETHYYGINNRNSVGKGGIAIIPFLDLNNNGRRDKHEPKAFGMKAGVNGGRILYNKSDTSILISDLEAYTSYIVTCITNGFENVGWQVRNKVYNITIDPNQLKLIEIPVMIVGEVSGMVSLSAGNNKKGLGRIIVNFYRNDSMLVGHTLTEADGYFNFSGLTKGSYVARIDTAQLKKISLISIPEALSFTVSGSQEGDVVDDLEFVLKNYTGETMSPEVEP